MSTEPPETDVSSAWPFKFQTVDIAGSQMAYVDVGPPSPSPTSPILLFLHGNSSSSYIWRNVIPSLSPHFRCIAPDLIGMGESAKPQQLSYSFTDHYTFISAFIKTVIPASRQLIIIAHDWGTALALHWSHQNASRLAGLVLMEFVRTFPKWDTFADPATRAAWKSFRDPVNGREMVINQNLIMGPMIAHAAKRGLSEEELLAYRKPFAADPKNTLEPIWKWTTQIPIEEDPVDVWDIATRYERWLIEGSDKVPKLFFYYEDAPLVDGEKMRWYIERVKNARAVDVGVSGHFVMEDHPRKVVEEIQSWLQGLGV